MVHFPAILTVSQTEREYLKLLACTSPPTHHVSASFRGLTDLQHFIRGEAMASLEELTQDLVCVYRSYVFFFLPME